MHTYKAKNSVDENPPMMKNNIMKKKMDKKCGVNPPEDGPVVRPNKEQRKMRRKIMRRAMKLGIYPAVYSYKGNTQGVPCINMRKFYKKNPSLVQDGSEATRFLSLAPVNRKKDKKTQRDNVQFVEMKEETENETKQTKKQNHMGKKKHRRERKANVGEEGSDQQAMRNNRQKRRLLKRQNKLEADNDKVTESHAEEVQDNGSCLISQTEPKPDENGTLQSEKQRDQMEKKKKRSPGQHSKLQVRKDKKQPEGWNYRMKRLALRRARKHPFKSEKVWTKNKNVADTEANQPRLRLRMKHKPELEDTKATQPDRKSKRNKLRGKVLLNTGENHPANVKKNAKNIEDCLSEDVEKSGTPNLSEPTDCQSNVGINQRKERKLRRKIRKGNYIPKIYPGERMPRKVRRLKRRQAKHNSMEDPVPQMIQKPMKSGRDSCEKTKDARKLRRNMKSGKLPYEIPVNDEVATHDEHKCSEKKRKHFLAPGRNINKPRFVMYKRKRTQRDEAEQSTEATPGDSETVGTPDSTSVNNAVPDGAKHVTFGGRKCGKRKNRRNRGVLGRKMRIARRMGSVKMASPSQKKKKGKPEIAWNRQEINEPVHNCT